MSPRGSTRFLEGRVPQRRALGRQYHTYAVRRRRQKITSPGSSPRDARGGLYPQDQTRKVKKAFWRKG